MNISNCSEFMFWSELGFPTISLMAES